MFKNLRADAEPRNLRRQGIIIIGILLSLGLSSVDGNANWQAEWEKTLKAARTEGSVAVYATSSVGDLRIVWEAFRKRYPKIKLINVVPGRGTAGVIRIMAERRARKYLADVILMNPHTIYRSFYRKRNILEPLAPVLMLPEVTDVAKWWQGKHYYFDPEGQYIFSYEGKVYGLPLSYNTKLVKQGEIKSVWDILQPKWKGKITAFDLVGAGQAGSTALTFMYHHPQIGPKLIKGVYEDTDAKLFRSPRQGADWLSTGRYALCFLCRRIQRAKEQGLPVTDINPYDLKESPGLGSSAGAVAIPTHAPHLNAAKVFVNWYLSREGQIAFRKANLDDDRLNSLREDLPPSIVPDLAKRNKGREYVFINQPSWADFRPIFAILKEARRKTQRGR